MKDFVSKGTGNSRFLKSVSNFLSLYPNYEDFAAALIAGDLPVDFNGVNADGVTQLGTALNKANLLADATASELGLTQADPTVNDALYVLSQKGTPAEVHVLTTSGTTVTMTKGEKTLTATAGSDGFAILYPSEFGDWTVTASGTSKVLDVNAIAVFYVSMATLESLSWAVISSVSKAGLASKMWNIGDKKSISIGGVTYQAQIIGFDHDNVTNSGTYGRAKAGITWQLVDCLNTTYKMENSNINTNGWDGCVMRSTNLPAIKGTLPSDLQNVLVKVNKLASAGNQSTTIKTSSDDLFLLAEIEIFGATTYSKAGEGSQYAWYAAGNTKIKKVNGSANTWWERSPNGSNTAHFCDVGSGGNASNDGASDSRGVSFGFCV